MPLTPLQESLDRTGSAFDQKLQQLMGMAESVRASKMRKQQLAQQIEQQKDLIQFRSDVELQQQKQFYEDVTKPKQEAEARQEYLEDLKESFEDAQVTRRELANREAQKQGLYKYNLADFQYEIEPVQQEDGKLQGYKPQIYHVGGNGQKQAVDYQTFTDVLEEYEGFASFLDSLQDQDLGVSDVETREINGREVPVSLVGSDKVEDYVSQIKTDPEFRMQEFRKYKQGLVRPAKLEEVEGEGKSRSTPLTDSIPLMGRLKEALAGKTSKNYVFNEDITSFFGGDIAASSTVDFTSSISGVQEQINKTLRQGVLPKGSEFDLSALPEGVRQGIIAGDLTDEMWDAVPEKMVDDVETLESFSGESKEKLNELFKFYNLYESFYNEYSRVSRNPSAPNEIFLDLWDLPDNLQNLDEYTQQAAKPISKAENRKKLNQFGINLRRESDVTARWMGFSKIGN